MTRAIKFKKKGVETDAEVIERISTRFQILDDMTKAAIRGDIRAMIVQGPPGVGKSFGVEQQLERASLLDTVASRPKPYDIVKGAMSAIGLYCKLNQYRHKDNILIFDDCDSVLQDELSLNILKAALDSKRKRRICWNTDSYKLRNEGVPDMFYFEGSAIFITNIKFSNIKSKKLKDHLSAISSRCHYVDLTLDTNRELLLRIRQIAGTGALFANYEDLTTENHKQIINFMEDNQDKLQEVSLRMALKIADLFKVSETNWEQLALATCVKR
jgi:hypothetical protein|tara:strand:+ start:111 stop:923 length:813 start_codon:yes stop_codon:yes gene_type:complete